MYNVSNPSGGKKREEDSDAENDRQWIPEDAKVFEVIRNLLEEREEEAKDLKKKDQTGSD
ncbi:hypothetical protein BSL78_07569 [Apostichopus japonicus]|uniref:Uncharacterized protein n=1 Tax=Stichopus japonicus TaxID=307972 RepID=A0A2G8L5R3_STIJA|nr:hypothetical protein BSL78_07569 [Apostichopus japonicus]